MCFLKHIASALQPLLLPRFRSGSYFFCVTPVTNPEVLGICGVKHRQPWLTTTNWHTEAIKRQAAIARGKSLTINHTFAQDMAEDPALGHVLLHAGEVVGRA